MAVHELKVQLSLFRVWGRKDENQIKIIRCVKLELRTWFKIGQVW
jgi:hypothetical protein